MIEAAKTTATAGEIWVICVVMVVCLAFWLSMVAWADRHPVWRGRHMPEMPGPVLGGMHVAEGGRSVAPHREAPPVLTIEESVEVERGEDEGAATAAAAAERPRVPGQRGAGARAAPAGAGVGEPARAAPAGGGEAGAVPGMPAPRSGEADQPEPSVAGPGGAERGDGEG